MARKNIFWLKYSQLFSEIQDADTCRIHEKVEENAEIQSVRQIKAKMETHFWLRSKRNQRHTPISLTIWAVSDSFACAASDLDEQWRRPILLSPCSRPCRCLPISPRFWLLVCFLLDRHIRNKSFPSVLNPPYHLPDNPLKNIQSHVIPKLTNLSCLWVLTGYT